MMRIGTIGRVSATQGRPAQAARGAGGRPDAPETRPPARALVVLDGGLRDAAATRGRPVGAGRGSACFVAQLIVADDPDLRPSRLVRTRQAAALYAETARRLARGAASAGLTPRRTSP